MIISITTTHRPATDLGYLLVKHPDKVQQFDLPHGSATVFYPEASAERCTAALMLEIDPVKLTRGRQGSPQQEDYVNDRPYAAASYLAAAINRVYRSACAGQSRDRQQLAETPIPLEIRIPAVRSGKSGNFLRRLFEPLGYQSKSPSPRWIRPTPNGAPAATPPSPCAAAPPSRKPCASYASCCPSWTAKSTTGSPMTKSTSCCGPARAGSTPTRKGKPSPAAT